ncbi:MAG: 16S rRNA (cytidine(1402)-2'-O)-methyltransferase [Eubacteriales bacterium]
MAFEIQKGTLYVVPTPIGNLGDISARALDVLRGVDFVAAEDTRVSGKLLALLDIHQSFVSYHEHNKAAQGEKIAARLAAGESAAIVTDAGTPAVSDPGEALVALCRKRDIPVVPLPGACAFVTALSGSGFPSRRFCFEGFLPSDKKQRREILAQYRNEPKTVIFYEAPHRLAETVGELYETLGNRRLCVTRELTKLNEEFYLGTLAEFCEQLAAKEPRGEYVLILEGAPQGGEEAFFENMSVPEHVAFYEKQGLSRMDAIKACARDRHVAKNEIYKQLL